LRAAEEDSKTGALGSPPAATFVVEKIDAAQLPRPPEKPPFVAVAYSQGNGTGCGRQAIGIVPDLDDIAPETLPRPPEPQEVATANHELSRITSNLRDELALLTGKECSKISLNDITAFAAAEAARQGLSKESIDALVIEIRQVHLSWEDDE